MTISRLVILQALLALGLSSVFFIPRDQHIKPSRINMELPESIGDWEGKPAEVTQKERDILAKDTQFSRKLYTDSFGDQAFVSIVLSGQDLDNSIHRPERCLPAQGWTLVDTSGMTLPVAKAPAGLLPVTRLHDMREAQGADGKIVHIYNLDYYWFVGYTDITASHLTREMIDMKDRLLLGYNQRWAYITVSSIVTEGLTQFGRSEQQTDKMLQELIEKLYPGIVKDSAPPDPKQG